MNSIVKTGIEKIAVDFLLQNVKEYPIDVYQLADKIFDRVYTYSEYELSGNTKIKNAIQDGFTVNKYDDKGNRTKYELYYNSSVLVTRQRFTIMHEIGHIILKHSQASNLAEREANYFAGFCLAPFVLILYSDLHNSDEVKQVFNISKKCADNVWKNYLYWKHNFICKRRLTEYEKILAFKLFSGEINIKVLYEVNDFQFV